MELDLFYDKLSICYHESSHCIISILSFMQPDTIELTSIPEPEGACKCFYFKNLKDIEDYNLFKYLFDKDICMRSAGMLGERLLYKKLTNIKVFPNILKSHSREDIKDIANLFKTYNIASPGKKRQIYKNKLIRETSNLLEIYWVDVILLAQSLFQRKKLNYLDIKSILVKKSENRNFWKLQFKKIERIFKNLERLAEVDIMAIIAVT